MNKKINIVTLGCSKNLVDSENIITQLKANNYEVTHNQDASKTDIAIINTCGFIKDAKQESIDTILEFVRAKERGEIDQVFVIGCLSERYKKELESEVPEVDQYFGVNDMTQILHQLKADYRKELVGQRLITTPGHYAYLKISEGCDRSCSFCAIPLIRGGHVSVPIEDLVNQATNLVKTGSKEIILIAQDLSYYGYDIYKKFKLAELVDRLANVKGLEWLRLHYAYPSWFPPETLDVMAAHSNICKYIDIPFQHISDKMLELMRRGHSKEQTLEFIKMLRTKVPDIAIRTTLLVGHPGETKKEFEELKHFVKESRFERLGVFTYSEEEGTWSAQNYKDSISNKEKERRLAEIMEIQQTISHEINEAKTGTVQKVIIDRIEGDYFIGRTQFDSPEVDNEVLIKKQDKTLQIGNFYNIRITSADAFDIYGELI